MLVLNRRFRHSQLAFPSSLLPIIVVITGFNTDIEYEGVTYHVQTEDKGLSKPVILSLIYNGGTILASKRAPYDDLLAADFDEKELAERLNKQHRLICAAIKAGRLEDLKQMNSKRVEQKAAVDVLVPGVENTVLETAPPINDFLPKPDTVPLDDFERIDDPIPMPDFGADEKEPDPDLIDEPILEAVAILELDDEILLSPDAVAIIEEPGLPERPFNNRLGVEILGDIKFKGGERNTVGLMVSRGTARKVVEGAQIMVKILGSSFRPIIFHAVTDVNGIAHVNLQVPKFNSGRAAFLVRAMSDGEEVELRRAVEHG